MLGKVRPVVFVLGIGLLGCGDGTPTTRFPVSGSLTFDGKPVKSGQITFDPVGSKTTKGLQGIAKIRDGRYDTAADGGKSPSAGSVTVRIDGLGEPTKSYPGGKPLFLDYQVKFEVPSEPATKDFAVPASAATKVPDDPGPAP